jgi:Raf kinase inhibitor-like YbhB/YbcL family protein
VLLAAAAAATVLLAACSTDGRALRAPSPDQTLSIVTTSTTVAFEPEPEPEDTDAANTEAPTTTIEALQALALMLPFENGGRIPDQHSCRGANVSPAMTWANVPEGTQELAVVVTDLDSTPPGFAHWVVTGIPADSTGLPEGDLAGALEQLNDAGGRGWGGPCLDAGEHTYAFTLYALDSPVGLPAQSKAADVIAAIESRILASVAVTGVWSPTAPDTTTPEDTSTAVTTTTTVPPASTTASG